MLDSTGGNAEAETTGASLNTKSEKGIPYCETL